MILEAGEYSLRGTYISAFGVFNAVGFHGWPVLVF